MRLHRERGGVPRCNATRPEGVSRSRIPTKIELCEDMLTERNNREGQGYSPQPNTDEPAPLSGHAVPYSFAHRTPASERTP